MSLLCDIKYLKVAPSVGIKQATVIENNGGDSGSKGDSSQGQGNIAPSPILPKPSNSVKTTTTPPVLPTPNTSNQYQGVVLKMTDSKLTIKQSNGKSKDFTVLVRTVFFSVKGTRMEYSGLKIGNVVKFRTSPGDNGELEIKRLEVTAVK